MGEVIEIPYKPRAVFWPYHDRAQRWAVIVAHRRAGKCLDVDTPIPTPAGFVRMGDLVAGDTVFAADGTLTQVVAAHDVKHGLPCYMVRFSDGAEIVCDSEHLWFTQTKADRAHHTGVRRGPRGGAKYISRTHMPRPGSVKTTEQIRTTLTSRGEVNHHVPLAEPVAYPEADLPLDPYCLGAWLGDGTSRSAQVTTMDPVVIGAFMVFWHVRPTKQQSAGLALTYTITGGLHFLLRTLGVLGNKHIPAVYLRGSIEQRKALLAGLMDTDGTISNRSNSCEIVQKRPEMAEGIKRLLTSLGVTFGVSIHKSGAYRIRFTPRFNPFRVARKAERWAPTDYWSARARAIVAVEPVESRPVRCIQVSHASSLFLAGDRFVPTHNTVACINDLIKSALMCPREQPRCAYVAPFFRQAKDVAWEYLKRFTAPIPDRLVHESELRVDFPNGGRVRLYGADNPDGMRGIYLDDCVLDEFADMRPRFLPEVIRPALSDRKGRLTLIGTPRGENEFFEAWQSAGSDPEWFRVMLKASETGLVDADELADARKMMSEEQYAQEFECSWSAPLLGAYYGRLIEAAETEGRIAELPHRADLPVWTAWDLGVGDDTSIWFAQRVGGWTHLIDHYATNGQPASHYVEVLNRKPYTYAGHILPHDADSSEWLAGKKRIDVLKSLGLKDITVLERAPVDDGINAARLLLPVCRFDREKCAGGLKSLRQYRREYDEDKRTFKPTPLHNWASHDSDSFRYLACGLKPETVIPPEIPAYYRGRRNAHRGGSNSWMAS